MSVTYNRVNFVNRYVEHAKTYTLQENQDGTVTLVDAPGEVYHEGTKLNAANMNNLDKGISDCAELLNSMEEDVEDLKEHIKRFTATIPASGWESHDGGKYYTISITVSGILATDTPDIGIIQTGTWATDEAIRDAWSFVARITASANALNIMAYAVPSAAYQVQVRCIR